MAPELAEGQAIAERVARFHEPDISGRAGRSRFQQLSTPSEHWPSGAGRILRP